MNLAEYITAHGLKAEATPADSNPNMSDPDPGAHHWTVSITGPMGVMSLPFTQGSALTDPPSLADVLDCIASDASLVDEYADPVELALSLGETIENTEDVQRAKATHEAITRNRAELRRILGSDEALDALLYEVGRA